MVYWTSHSFLGIPDGGDGDVDYCAGDDDEMCWQKVKNKTYHVGNKRTCLK